MPERLQKIIARAGIASRREAEIMISEGRVQVNGALVTEQGVKVDPAHDHIKVDGKRLKHAPKNVYILLNKPKRYITTRHDPEGRPTVMDLIPEVKERVSPVGRLDYETEGLLLLTNDGDLSNALMHPKNEVEKTYWAKVRGHLSGETLLKIAHGGISLPTGKTAPCKIRALHRTDENGWVELILHEGKKREVRRVLERVGHPVVKLKRVAYAFLKIKGLPLGKYRHLTSFEIAKLRAVALGEPFEPPVSKKALVKSFQQRSTKRKKSTHPLPRQRRKS
ncbi:MAG: pseudouridine synthase [Nitrospiria bacterium]